ncbi:hypothetical protein [Klebsiella quasipneumoniae]
MGEISVKTGNNARNGGKNSLNRLIRCVCGKKIGPDPRNFNQRVSLGRNDLLIRTFPRNKRYTMANFLYWDYLVWFSYAAMPVVIFFIILFKHKGKSANSNPEELKSSSLRSKNHIKNEKSEGLDSTTIFQNERIIDDFDPTDPFSLASRMNQHLHEYPESKFD